MPIKVPKISQFKIEKILKKRKLENIDSIAIIEKFFLKKRGFIFKMPKPGNSVILLLSGGIDSTITWFLLMHVFKLTVYPLVQISEDSGTGSKTYFKYIKNISLYAEEYYQKYFREPHFFYKDISVNSIFCDRVSYLKTHKYEFFNSLNQHNFLEEELPAFTSFYISPSLQYKNFLQMKDRVKINTFFMGIIPRDGLTTKAQTFTAIRSMMFHACNVTQDYNLQFVSLPMEKELGYFFNTQELIKIAHKQDWPLKHTWSCYKKGKWHCGKCSGCGARNYAFKKAKVEDPTLYFCNTKNFILDKMRIMKQKVKNFLR